MAITDDRDEYDRDGDASPIEMDAPVGDLSSTKTHDPKAVEEVLYSDVGIKLDGTKCEEGLTENRLGSMSYYNA